MARRFIALVLAALAFAPTTAFAAKTKADARKRVDARPLDEGFLYAGVAPGMNFGGHALPRALYMDVLNAGWVLPQGIDLSFALTGTNLVPDAGDYSVTMGRLAVGYRPFLRDPLPILQPYVLAGAGLGGEGRYLCEPEPSCDPATTECRDVCGRANWAMSLFAGGGLDANFHLVDVGDQQLLAFAGIQARYEYIPDRFHMPVVTFPIGVKLQ